MEMIERYLLAVGRRLPRKDKADILEELRSTLVDMLDDQYGPEPSENEVIELLKTYGRPEEIAASYYPAGQYLVGPELFPLFRMITGIVLLVIAVVQSVLGGFLAATGQLQIGGVPEFVADLFGSLTGAFGMIVLVFYLLQRFGVQPKLDDEPWDPKTLPTLSEADESVDRTGAIIGIVFGVLLIVLFTAFIDKVGMVTFPGANVISNPVLVEYRWWIVLGLSASVLLDIWKLEQGRWTLPLRSVRLGLSVYSIFVLYTLVAGHAHWLAAHGASGFLTSVEALGEAARSGTMDSVTQVIGMHAFLWAFAIALIVNSLELVKEGYLFFKKSLGQPGKNTSLVL